MNHKENIGNAMQRFYSVDMTLAEAEVIIRSIEPDLLAVYPDYAADENDYRLGNDTYGYDEEFILTDLQYVSDRWGAAFRIAWILGIVNKDYRG